MGRLTQQLNASLAASSERRNEIVAAKQQLNQNHLTVQTQQLVEDIITEVANAHGVSRQQAINIIHNI